MHLSVSWDILCNLLASCIRYSLRIKTRYTSKIFISKGTSLSWKIIIKPKLKTKHLFIASWKGQTPKPTFHKNLLKVAGKKCLNPFWVQTKCICRVKCFFMAAFRSNKAFLSLTSVPSKKHQFGNSFLNYLTWVWSLG